MSNVFNATLRRWPKKQQLLADFLMTRETACRQLEEEEESLQKLQSILATMTAGLREWRELAAETAKEVNVAMADSVLQSRI